LVQAIETYSLLNIPGEDVYLAVEQLDAINKRISACRGDQMPFDFANKLYTIFTTSSCPEFNNKFQRLIEQLDDEDDPDFDHPHARGLPNAQRGQRHNDLASLLLITRKASMHYSKLLGKGKWPFIPARPAFTASNSTSDDEASDANTDEAEEAKEPVPVQVIPERDPTKALDEPEQDEPLVQRMDGMIVQWCEHGCNWNSTHDSSHHQYFIDKCTSWLTAVSTVPSEALTRTTGSASTAQTELVHSIQLLFQPPSTESTAAASERLYYESLIPALAPGLLPDQH